MNRHYFREASFFWRHCGLLLTQGMSAYAGLTRGLRGAYADASCQNRPIWWALALWPWLIKKIARDTTTPPTPMAVSRIMRISWQTFHGSLLTDNPKFPLKRIDCTKGNAMQNWDPPYVTNQYLATKSKNLWYAPAIVRHELCDWESISVANMVHIMTCAHVGTLQVWPCARSLRTEMIQKSLRGLTPTTFLLTPQALSATLLLKMNREVFNVAHMYT